MEPKLLLLDEPTAGTGRDETTRLVGVLGRLKARLFAVLFRWAFFVTAWFQARQLAPIVGEAGSALRGKILHKFRADLPFLFGPRNRVPVSLDWWWATPTPARRPTPPHPDAKAA